MAAVAQDTEQTLAGLSAGDFSLLETAVGLREAQLENTGLDARTFALVKIASLIALDAPPASYAWQITNALEENFVARKLAPCRSVLCASPEYVKRHGKPKHASDLKSHNCITHAFGSGGEYRLRHEGETVAVAVRGTLFSNETAVLRQAALEGAGIALLPTYYVIDELRRGGLVRLLPDHEPEPLGIHAVYLSRQHQPQALRELITFLVERFGGKEAPWDEGPSGSKRRRR